jgi:hypothetical protein
VASQHAPGAAVDAVIADIQQQIVEVVETQIPAAPELAVRQAPTAAPTPVVQAPLVAVQAPQEVSRTSLLQRPARPAVPAAPVAPAVRVATPALEALAPPKALKVIQVLYIDCGPNGPVVDATEVLALAKERLVVQGIEDWRYVDFGKGAGLLAKAVGQVLDEGGDDVAFVRLDSGSSEYTATSYEFVARARVVVR